MPWQKICSVRRFNINCLQKLGVSVTNVLNASCFNDKYLTSQAFQWQMSWQGMVRGICAWTSQLYKWTPRPTASTKGADMTLEQGVAVPLLPCCQPPDAKQTPSWNGPQLGRCTAVLACCRKPGSDQADRRHLRGPALGTVHVSWKLRAETAPGCWQCSTAIILGMCTLNTEVLH